MSEPPRWLDAPAAAAHLSMRVDAFLRKVHDDKLPPASRHLGERTPRWDRHALDSAMMGDTMPTNTRGAFDAMAEEIQKTEGRARRQAQAS